ncbi:MAG: VOC family protein [Myxococcales bacterium]|nr:VOC family protein [Myxococcales bacterium]MBL0195837.1 VOC family protein [Myxococcales bacterium]HQY60126.1 VOC family protein [Polyangiaceae bacterium]
MLVRHTLTILAVERLAESVAFYRAAFAWPEAVETPVYVELALPGGQRLGLYEREAFGRNTGQVPARVPAGALSTTELYLHADDLEAAIAALEAAGARCLSPRAPRPWGDEAAYFADPSGNVLVVARALGA